MAKWLKMLTAQFTDDFRKQYKKLSSDLKKKFDKQFKYLLSDFHHPSLRARKMGGKDKYEARLDYHDRFTYKIIGEEIWFFTIGPHDEGLGKK